MNCLLREFIKLLAWNKHNTPSQMRFNTFGESGSSVEAV